MPMKPGNTMHKHYSTSASYLVVLTTLVSTIPTVRGFTSGAADPGSCADLEPVGHGASTASGTAPYELNLSKADYMPGDTIQVTLQGVGGAQFKGFLVAGRREDGSTKDNFGTFSLDTTGNSKIVCTQPTGNALTHTEAASKSSVNFNWTAPTQPEGNIVLHYTVVRGGAPSTSKNIADYFKDIKSVVITGPDPVFSQADSFRRDPECGKTKGCYSDCSAGECDWEITWQDSDDVYNISLKTTYDGSDNKYVALGFSTQPGMAQASVLACIASGGTVRVAGSYNPGYSNSPWANPTEGISNVQTSYEDGLLKCTFLKEKLSTNPQIFNLTEPWHIITARGSTTPGGNLLQHDFKSRFFTEAKVNLSLTTTDETFITKHTTVTRPPGTTPASGTTFPKDPDCGRSKGCYSDCGDGCSLLLSWAPSSSNSSEFEFTIEAVYTGTGDHYVAMGFSTQNKMDTASVVACTYVSGVVDVYASFNPGYYNIQLPNPKEGISNIQTSMNNGVMKCTFNRVKTSRSNSAQIFDLSQPWHLIVALGDSGPGGILREHNNKDRYVTSFQIDFSDTTSDIGLSKLDYPRIKWHACLMIIGWMLSGSIGLAFAKYFKKQWPSRTLCGVKIWFAIHRFCMVFLFIVCSVSILLVFLEIDGYSDIHGETYKKAHPILGIVTTSLMVINPFMSLLRCGPDHPQRWVFNWSHWAVGTSAHILSGVTISLGMYLPKSQMDKDLGLLIMIIYGVWHVIFNVVCGVLDYLSSREERRVFALEASQSSELKPYAPSPNAQPNHSHSGLNAKIVEINSNTNLVVDPLKSDEPPKSGTKKIMMIVHVCMLTVLSIYLIVLVIDGE